MEREAYIRETELFKQIEIAKHNISELLVQLKTMQNKIMQDM